MRRAARQSKSVRFTALLHHITIDLLKQGYLSLERDSAPAIDGVSRFSVSLIRCAGGEYCGVRHDRHLSAVSISRVPAYGCAQAECDHWGRRRTRPFGLTRLRLRRGRPRAWPSWRLPARLQRVSPRPKRAAAVNHLARFGAHARALQPHLQAMTQCATAPPLAAGVLQGSKRTVQASRARCAHRRSLACVAFWQLQDRHFANCRRQTT